MKKQVVELIRKAQGGNQSAFNYLVTLHDERITKLIYTIMQNKEDTEDIYQEVFIKVWKKIKTFQFESEFYTWLYTIAVNTCYNYKQNKSRRKFIDDPEYETG